MGLRITINKVNLIFWLILIFPVIIDLIIGIFYVYNIEFPIGKSYRGFIYLLSTIYILVHFNKLSFYYLLFLLLWVTHCIFWINNSSNFSIARELNYFLKVSYLIPLFHVLNIHKNSIEIRKIVRTIFLISKIISVAILFSFFTGMGIKTYGNYSFAVKSFFIGSNNVGIALLVIYTFLLFNRNKFNVSVYWLITIHISLTLFGTTTGMFGSILVLLIYILYGIFLKRIRNKKQLQFRFFSIVFSILFTTTLSFILLSYIQDSSYYSRKYDKFLEDGPRSKSISIAKKYMSSRSDIQNTFGEGFSAFTYNVGNSASEFLSLKNEDKDWLLIESDFYDITLSYGYILSVFLFGFYIYILREALLNYINNQATENFSLLLITFILFGHSFFAGHVLYSPTTLGLVAPILFLIKKVKN